MSRQPLRDRDDSQSESALPVTISPGSFILGPPLRTGTAYLASRAGATLRSPEKSSVDGLRLSQQLQEANVKRRNERDNWVECGACASDWKFKHGQWTEFMASQAEKAVGGI